ncbi:MAG: flavodoxin family protein [Proteobacteria bacterium]|nr:flavodoxin family protein [Pseudomonadota bacterium]
MKILAFNGSLRKGGNTSRIIGTVLEGAAAAGAETTEVRLHDIQIKGCRGCLSCRTNPGVCAQKDELSPFLEKIKTCDGIVVGSPIYMYHITAQIKIFVDRNYSFYINREDGGYDTAVPPGKTFALVISQGADDAERFQKPIRWLAGMTGGGHGMNEVGRIVHTGSQQYPAKDNKSMLTEAYEIGRKLVKGTEA